MGARLIMIGSLMAALVWGYASSNNLLGGPLPYGSPGTPDFIEYWSAFQLFSAGLNPYDADLMLEIEKGLGWPGDTALMMWNPPWLLLLLAPVLALDFAVAARLWLFASPILLLGTAVLVVNTLSRGARLGRASFYGICLATLFFVPVWNSVFLGQLGLLLTFGVALLYWSVVGRHMLGVPFALLILSVKPHLFLFLGVAVLWWILRTRETRILLGTVFLPLVAAGLSILVSPPVVSQWLAAVSGSATSVGTIAPNQWAGSTLVSPVRGFLASVGMADTAWVMVAVPATAAALLVVYLRRNDGPEPWESTFLPLLCLSVWVSSFGWLFDHSVLLVVQLVVVGGLFGGAIQIASRVGVLALMAGIQLLVPVMVSAGYDAYAHYWWFPLSILGLHWVHVHVGAPRHGVEIVD